MCCSVLHCRVKFVLYTVRLHTNECVAVSFGPHTRVSVLQCVAVCCSVLQCGAVCCSVLQCVAVCCSVFCTALSCRAESDVEFVRNPECMHELVNTHVCCSVVQCVAVYCIVLQVVAGCCRCRVAEKVMLNLFKTWCVYIARVWPHT